MAMLGTLTSTLVRQRKDTARVNAVSMSRKLCSRTAAANISHLFRFEQVAATQLPCCNVVTAFVVVAVTNFETQLLACPAVKPKPPPTTHDS